MYPHNQYDPELHGDEEAPSAAKPLALAMVLLFRMRAATDMVVAIVTAGPDPWRLAMAASAATVIIILFWRFIA